MPSENFRDVYERHVGHVVAGDMKAAVADMVPENVPAVFEGVTVPSGQVSGADIRSARTEGERAIGDAVYQTPDGEIGLRSIWIERDGRWLAAELENFSPEAHA